MSQSSPSATTSHRSSPSHSFQTHGHDISIETLVSWLVAAKRSLSSINHVHRATTILSEARTTVESTTALIARTKYLRRTLGSQLKILRSIQFELETAAQAVRVEVQATVRELQAADRQLSANIEVLEGTKVERGFQAPFDQDDEVSRAEAEKRSLRDYVDDRPVLELRQNAQEAMDNIDSAQSNIKTSIQNLEEDLQQVNDMLNDRTATSSSTRSDFQQPHIPKILKGLERHARVMAESLESLVRHFDLCVTAIKHTEGGGAAVAQTVNPEDLPEGVDVHSFEAPTQPISDEERMEMLRVLETDAAEVDEVVIEIQDRSAKMDTQLDHIFTWRDNSAANYGDVVSAFVMLDNVSNSLRRHLADSFRFAGRCSEETSKLGNYIVGMEELCGIYEAFLGAYDGMIVEAARRRSVRKRMEKVVMEAQAQLDQLYDDDLTERELFRADRGGHLPGDIWGGLESLPARFAFQRLNEEESGSVPDLPKETVAAALKRLKAAQGVKDTK